MNHQVPDHILLDWHIVAQPLVQHVEPPHPKPWEKVASGVVWLRHKEHPQVGRVSQHPTALVSICGRFAQLVSPLIYQSSISFAAFSSLQFLSRYQRPPKWPTVHLSLPLPAPKIRNQGCLLLQPHLYRTECKRLFNDMSIWNLKFLLS